MKLRRLLFLVVSLCVSGCSVGIVHHNELVETTPALQYFYTTEEYDPFPSVGSIITEEGDLIGSGVLIESDKLLTAAHVVERDIVYYFNIGDELILIERVLIHKNYINTTNDIAIAFLSCDSSVKPTTLIGTGDILKRRTPLVTVGFSRGYKKYSDPKAFSYFGRLIEEPGHIKFLPIRATIWFGDSGGGVFTYINGRLKLVGIMSYFALDDGIICENSAISVKYYRNWIDENLE